MPAKKPRTWRIVPARRPAFRMLLLAACFVALALACTFCPAEALAETGQTADVTLYAVWGNIWMKAKGGTSPVGIEGASFDGCPQVGDTLKATLNESQVEYYYYRYDDGDGRLLSVPVATKVEDRDATTEALRPWYVWYRDGVEIAGSGSRDGTYTVTLADHAKRLSVEVFDRPLETDTSTDHFLSISEANAAFEAAGLKVGDDPLTTPDGHEAVACACAPTYALGWTLDAHGALRIFATQEAFAGSGGDEWGLVPAAISGKGDVPWHSYRSQVSSVAFATGGAPAAVKPYSMAYWFADMPNLAALDLTNVDSSLLTGTAANPTGASGLFSSSGLATIKLPAAWVGSAVARQALSTLPTGITADLTGRWEWAETSAGATPPSYTAYMPSQLPASIAADKAGTWVREAKRDVTVTAGAGIDVGSVRIDGVAGLTAKAQPGNEVSLEGSLATGYQQVAWSSSDVALSAASGTSTTFAMPAKAVGIVVSATPNTYNVAYELDGGSYGGEHPTSATWDTAFVVDAPSRTGYDFAGWDVTGLDASRHYDGGAETTATSLSGTTQTSFKNLTATQGATVTFAATWEPHTAEVTFQKDAQDAVMADLAVTQTSPAGSGLAVADGKTATLTYDVTYTLTGTIRRDYHTFHGWSTTQNATAASTAAGWATGWNAETGAFVSTIRNVTTGTDSANAYAAWTRNTYDVVYAPGEGGTQDGAASEDALTAGSPYTAKSLGQANIVAKPGYYFVGWVASVSTSGARLAANLPEHLLGTTTVQTGLVAENSVDGVTVTLTADWGIELTAVWADVTLQNAREATGQAQDTTTSPYGVLLKVGGSTLAGEPVYGQTLEAEIDYSGVRGYYYAYHSDDNGVVSIDADPTYVTISATEEPIDPYYTWYRDGAKVAGRSGRGSGYSTYTLDDLDDIGKTFSVVVTDVHDDATPDETAAAAGQYLGRVTSATTSASKGYYDVTVPSGTGVSDVVVTQDGSPVEVTDGKAAVLATSTAKVTVAPAEGYHLEWSTKPEAISGAWATHDTTGTDATDKATAEFVMPAADLAMALGTNIVATGNGYTVVYDKNTTVTAVGGMPTSTAAVYDANVTLSSAEPTRTGYAFEGWSRAKDATTAEYGKGQTLARPNFKSLAGATQTLYAVWEAKAHRLAVTDDTGIASSVTVGGSSFSSGADADYNQAVSVDYTLEPGYRFDGWTWKDGADGSATDASGWTWGEDNARDSRLSGTGSSDKPLAFVMPDNDVAITANASPVDYTIAYDLYGNVAGTVAGTTDPSHVAGSGTTTKTGYQVEDASFTVARPTRAGYDFVGWQIETPAAHWGSAPALTTSDVTWAGATTSFDTVADLTVATGSYGNIALRAIWRPRDDTKVTVKYYLQDLDAAHNELESTYSLQEGATVETRASTTDATTGLGDSTYAKAFVGFELDTDPYRATDGGRDKGGTANATTFTVSADGTSTISIYYRPTLYSFALGQATPAYAATTAGSTPPGANTYYYGSTITLAGAAATGYSWSRWQAGGQPVAGFQNAPGTSFPMPAGDVTMTPVVTPNKYGVAFVDDAPTDAPTNDPADWPADVSEASGAAPRYDAEYELPADVPTRLGYDFAGWAMDDTSGVGYKIGYDRSASAGQRWYMVYTSGPNDGQSLYSGKAAPTLPATVHVATGAAGSMTGTLTAQWTTKTGYTVRYDANAQDPETGVYDMSVARRTDLVASVAWAQAGLVAATDTYARTGYTFAGWHTARVGGTRVEPTHTYGALANIQIASGATDGGDAQRTEVTLYAHWTPRQTAVTFDANVGAGGLGEGDTTVSLQIGHTTYTITYDEGGTPTATPAADLVGDAVDTVPGTQDHTARLTYDITYTITTTAHRPYFTFLGWSTTSDATEALWKDAGGLRLDGDGKDLSEALTDDEFDAMLATGTARTVYAVWRQHAYNVRYVSTDDAGNITQVGVRQSGLRAGESYRLLGAAAANLTPPAGRTLAGYRIEVTGGVDATGASYAATPNGSITLTEGGYIAAGATLGLGLVDAESTGALVTLKAVWEGNARTVTFDANGAGATVAPTTHVYARATDTFAAADLPTPVRGGYRFDGWYTDAKAGSQVGAGDAVPLGDTTYFAHWTAETYTITLDLAAGTMLVDGWTRGAGGYTKSYTVESAAVALPTAAGVERHGYGFSGWTGEGLPTPTSVANVAAGSMGDRHYTACWAPLAYTVSFDANVAVGDAAPVTGTMPDQTGLSYGEDHVLPANAFRRAGYVFAGWAFDASAEKADLEDGARIDDATVSGHDDGRAVTLFAVWTAEGAGRTDGTAYALLATEDGSLADGTSYVAGTLLFLRSFGTYGQDDLAQALTDVEGARHVGYVFGGVETEAWTGGQVPWRGGRDIDEIVAVLAPASQTVAPRSMSHWFDGCGQLATAELAGLSTGAVEDMAGLFYGCVSLEALDLSAFDTRAAVTMADLFARCDSLVAVKLGGNFAFRGAGTGAIATDADLQALLPETATTAAVPDTAWIAPNGDRTTNGAIRTSCAGGAATGWYRRAGELAGASLVLVVPGLADTYLSLEAGSTIADKDALDDAAGVPASLEVASWHTDESLSAASAVDFGPGGYPEGGLAAGSMTTLWAKASARGHELSLVAGGGTKGASLLRGAGTYVAGATVYVQASPAAGYQDVTWTDAAASDKVAPVEASGDMAGWQRFVMPDRAVTLTATAAPSSFEIVLATGGDAAGVTNAAQATQKVFETYATNVFLPNAAGTAASPVAVAAGGTANLVVPTAAWTVAYDLAGGTMGSTSDSVARGFGGYYTAENGEGARLVDSDGLLVAAGWKDGETPASRFAGEATAYAAWTDGSLTLPEPTRADYDFMGWSMVAGAATGALGAGTSYTPTSDVTLHATWKATSYDISYDLAGGRLPEGAQNPTSYTAFDSFSLVNPSKPGATFAGWTCAGLSFSGRETVSVDAGSARGNLAFRATWSAFEAEDYLVTITIDDNSALPASVRAHDTLVAAPASATEATFERDEWHLTGRTAAGQGVDATRTYTLLHNNATAFVLPTPEWLGRTLQGWTGESLDGVTRDVSVAAGSTGDLAFFAVGFGEGRSWGYNEYQVRFHSASAEDETPDQTSVQTLVWHEGALDAETAPRLDANAFVRTYDVTFDYNGGTDANAATEATHAATSTFAYWLRNDGGTTYTDGQAIVGNLTDEAETVELYAQWTAGSVTLPVPTRAGFELAGWSPVPAGGSIEVQAQGGSYVPASSMTLYAQWTPALVTVTFDPNQGQIATVASGTLVDGKAKMESYAGYPVGNATGNLVVGADAAPTTDADVEPRLLLGEAVPGGRTVTLTRPRPTANGWSYQVSDRTSATGVYTLTLLAKGLGSWNVGQAGNGTMAGLALGDAYALYTKSYVADNPVAALALLNKDVYEEGVANYVQYGIPVLQDGALAALPVAVRTGYAFAGWYTDRGISADPTAGTRVDSTVVLGGGVTGRVATAATRTVLTPATNATYFARWTPNTYKVRFDGNAGYPTGPVVDGEALALNRNTPVTGHMDAQQMTYDQPSALDTHTFVKRGYDFVGWNAKADGTGAKFGAAAGAPAADYAEGEVVRNLTAAEPDVTLYAQWRQTNAAGSAYAAFDAAGTLAFFRSEQKDVAGVGKTAVDISGAKHTGDIYAIDEDSQTDPYASVSQVPWASHMGQLRRVVVADYPAGVGGDKQLVRPVSMGHWFDGASGLVQADLEGVDTSAVTSMAGLFAGCARLTGDALAFGGGFDTGKVETMARMFAGATSLAALDVSGFDTGEVRDMGSMFDGCASLVVVVPAATPGQGGTIAGVSGNAWTTENVTNMRRMFAGCASLEALDVSAWDTAKVTTMEGLFDGCAGLRTLVLTKLVAAQAADEGEPAAAGGQIDLAATKWQTGEVADMADMFRGCARIGYLDLRRFDTTKVADLGGMFEGCARLSMVDLGERFSFLPCVASYDPAPNPKTGLRDDPEARKAVLPEPPADSIYSGGWAYVGSTAGAEVVSALYLREHYGETGGAYQAGTYLWPHHLPVSGGEGEDAGVLWLASLAVAGAAVSLAYRRRGRRGRARGAVRT